MRTTHVHSLEIKRLIPYDPDFHGLVDQDGKINLAFVEGSEEKPRFRILIEFYFKQREDGTEMGHIRVEALTVLHGVKIPRDASGSLNMREAPENVKRLVEGAVGEDLLIPISLAARLAHLPAPIPSPVIFPRAASAVSQTAEGREKRETRKTPPVKPAKKQ